MKFCSDCGQQVPDTARYCTGCGAVMAGNQVGGVTPAGMEPDVVPGQGMVPVSQTQRSNKGKLLAGLFVVLFLTAAGFWGWQAYGNASQQYLYPVIIGEKYGFINSSGKMVIQPKYDNAYQVQGDEMTPVKMNGKWGYVGGSAKTVIEPQYEEAGPFSEGLAYVITGAEQGGYIDKTGKMVLSSFAGTNAFHNGLAAVAGENGKWGFIDKKGNMVIQPIYDQVGVVGKIHWYRDCGFSEGLAAVKVGQNWGYIDTNGKMVIPPQFKEAKGFFEERALVVQADSIELIDKKGDIVFQFPKEWRPSGDFSDGLLPVRVGSKYGYIDKAGKIVIQPQYDAVEEFCEGLASVKIGKSMGYIDTSGKTVLQGAYEQVLVFNGGLVCVVQDQEQESLTYYDKTGKQIWSSYGQ